MDNILIEFLTKEKLRFIKLNMPIWEVKQHFPDMYEKNLFSSTKTTKTFRFESLKLYFYGKYLVSIEIDFSMETVRLPEEIYNKKLITTCPRTLEKFIDYLNSLNIENEKLAIETHSFSGNSKKLIETDAGIVKIKIGKNIYAKFLDKKLLSIRKAVM